MNNKGICDSMEWFAVSYSLFCIAKSAEDG